MKTELKHLWPSKIVGEAEAEMAEAEMAEAEKAKEEGEEGTTTIAIAIKIIPIIMLGRKIATSVEAAGRAKRGILLLRRVKYRFQHASY